MTAADPISFKSQVAPILLENCVACHGPKKAEGGYRLDNFEELQKPGDSGAAPLVAGDAAKSELVRRLTCADASERMPAESEPLGGADIEMVSKWCTEGAKFDGEKPGMPLPLVIPPKQYADPPVSYPAPVPITAMAFTPDGSSIVVGGYHELTVWNTADGTLQRRIKNCCERTFAILFSADGKTLIVGGGEPGKSGEVRLFDLESGNLKSVMARTTDVVLDLAIRPGAPELAVAAADGLIRIVNIDTSAEVRTIASHADWVTSVAWSDDGAKLASGSRDKSAKVIDAANGELIANYQGHAAAVRGVAFTPDGKQVLSAGSDNKLHRWEIEGAKRVAGVDASGEIYRLVRIGDVVTMPSADKHVRQVELAKTTVQRALPGAEDWVTVVAVSPAAHRVAGGTLSGEVRIWNSDDGALVKNWIAKP
ncbi:MAG: c-type cytochrome domain-containing protein [Pirellulales bacterium]